MSVIVYARSFVLLARSLHANCTSTHLGIQEARPVSKETRCFQGPNSVALLHTTQNTPLRLYVHDFSWWGTLAGFESNTVDAAALVDRIGTDGWMELAK